MTTMPSVKETHKKSFYFYGFGCRYAKAVTNEGESIKGFSLHAFGFCFMTVALADGAWVDSNGRPYRFEVDDKVLYINKLAISLF